MKNFVKFFLWSSLASVIVALVLWLVVGMNVFLAFGMVYYAINIIAMLVVLLGMDIMEIAEAFILGILD